MTKPIAPSAPYSQIASEFLLAMRGKRSPAVLSDRLGYRTNVVYRWETGLRHPTACQVLQLAKYVGVDPYSATLTFDYHLRGEVGLRRPTPHAIAKMMRAMAKGQTGVELARGSELSRFSVSRILSGQTEPRFPTFLGLVQAMTGRVLDWIAAFTSPRNLPSVADKWRELEAMRNLAHEHPLSEVILAALEVHAWQGNGTYQSGWLAKLLGLTEEREIEELAALTLAGVIQWRDKHWVVSPDRRVDTRQPEKLVETLKVYWANEACKRVEVPNASLSAYSVMSISQADLGQVADVLLQAYQRVRRICGESTNHDRVALVNINLCALDAKPILLARPQDEGGKLKPRH